MNKDLDDFFNEKLNDLSSSNDGWDEPSESVWANAQPNFPTYSKSKRNWLTALAILLGLTLLGTGTYLYKVKQANHALKQEMADLNQQLQQNQSSTKSSNNNLIRQNTTLQNQVEELQTKLIKEQATAQQSVKNAQNACDISVNKAIENNTIQYQKIIQEQQQLIQQLEKENQNLKSKNSQLQQQPMATKNDNVIANPEIKFNELTNYKSFFVENNTVKSITSPVLEQPGKVWKKYEFGIDLASTGFNVELTNSVENADFATSTTPNVDNLSATTPTYSVANAPSIGFHFGYGIREDFYIRTGMRYANFNINSSYSTDFIYDQSNEYLDNQGTVLNDLVLNSTTPFNNIQQGITVEIPDGTALMSDDIVQTAVTNSQNYHFLQVPLGIAYYRGKRRLQLEFQGGLTWNYILFNDYAFDANFRANDVTLPVNRSSVISNTTNTTSYLGAYLGLGANYKLSDSWQVRAGITFEETSLRTNAQAFPRRYLLESGLNLSLNYRF